MDQGAGYQFTNNWFGNVAKGVWDQLIPQIKPARVLEVGSFEGASACYLIDTLSSRYALELHCVDTWECGVEHTTGPDAVDMSAVEARFQHNVALSSSRALNAVQLHRHKGYATNNLPACWPKENGAISISFI